MFKYFPVKCQIHYKKIHGHIISDNHSSTFFLHPETFVAHRLHQLSDPQKTKTPRAVFASAIALSRRIRLRRVSELIQPRKRCCAGQTGFRQNQQPRPGESESPVLTAQRRRVFCAPQGGEDGAGPHRSELKDPACGDLRLRRSAVQQRPTQEEEVQKAQRQRARAAQTGLARDEPGPETEPG